MEKKQKGGKSATKGTKKDLEIVTDWGPMLKIKYKDGGQVPEMLAGQWTSHGSAQTQIDRYLIERDG